jgi:hypothetical protein
MCAPAWLSRYQHQKVREEMKHKSWCPIAKGLPPESTPCLCDDEPRRDDDPRPPLGPFDPDIDRYFFGPYEYDEFEPLIGRVLEDA